MTASTACHCELPRRQAGERGNLLVIQVVRRQMMAWRFPLGLPDAVSRFDRLSVTFGSIRLRRTRNDRSIRAEAVR
ncbi:MAG: hypothetical protein ACPL4I_06270, partial [Bacteroidota bacterium]